MKRLMIITILSGMTLFLCSMKCACNVPLDTQKIAKLNKQHYGSGANNPTYRMRTVKRKKRLILKHQRVIVRKPKRIKY